MSETSTIRLEEAVDAVLEILGPRRAQAIDADSRLVELGLDGLDAAELFLLLEEKAGFALDPASAGQIERVGDLTRLRPAAGS